MPAASATSKGALASTHTRPASAAAAAPTDVAEIQRDELLSLEAIFMDDFQRGPDVWGCPSFSIRVVPHTGDESRNFVAVTLDIMLDKRYPERPCVCA